MNTHTRRKPTPLIKVGRNQFGRYDCPWSGCPKHGQKGAATEWGVSTHLRRKHGGKLPPTAEGTGFKRPSLFTAATRAAAQATLDDSAAAALRNEIATGQGGDLAAGLLACPHCGPRVKAALSQLDFLLMTAEPASVPKLVEVIRGMITTDNHGPAQAAGSNGHGEPIAGAWQPATATS